MALGERFRSGGARGIAQFLAEHEHCDAGFDVRRDQAPGSGKLTVTCQGCGQTVSYNAAEVGEIGAFDLPEDALTRTEDRAPIDRPPVPAATPNGAGPPAVSDSGSVVTTGPGPRPAGGNRSGRLPRWAVPAAIGVLIAAGIAMIAVGLIRSGGDGQTDEDAPAPVEAEAPVEPAPPETAPAEPAAPADPAPAGQVALQNRSFGAFTVGVPAGWDATVGVPRMGRERRVRRRHPGGPRIHRRPRRPRREQHAGPARVRAPGRGVPRDAPRGGEGRRPEADQVRRAAGREDDRHLSASRGAGDLSLIPGHRVCADRANRARRPAPGRSPGQRRSRQLLPALSAAPAVRGSATRPRPTRRRSESR